MTRAPLICALVLFVTSLTGCADEPAAPRPAAEGPRVVTLAPAITHMLVDLGASDRLVGIAENDMAAPAGLPVVGHFTDVHTEALLRVRPTLVLTMTASQGPPARLRDLAAAGHFELVAYPYPRDLAEVLHILATPDDDAAPPAVGELIGRADAARALRQRIERQLDELGELTATEADAPAVLLVIGTNPLMASGAGTVHDELLAFAGGRNAAAGMGGTAVTFDREALIAMQPDVILILQPESPPLRDADPRLAQLHGLPVPAIENERVVLLNDPHILLPSTNLPRIVGAMAKAIHPDLADAIDRILENEQPR